MTAEKYVNAVVKKVKCSKSQREEFRQQLLSDISVAKEQGEQIEKILGRMGDIDTVVKEFNENLSERERKKYRRARIVQILCAVLLLLALATVFAWWFLPKYSKIGSGGKFEEQGVKARVSEVIELLNENNYAALREHSIPAMERVLTEETLGSAKKQVSEDWGAFQSLGKPYMVQVSQQGKVFAVVQVVTLYENVTVTFTITFDPELRLAGLYMK